MGKQEKGKISEDHLPQPEVGKIARTLIQEYKQVIQRRPEFVQALLDRYLSEWPDKKLDDPVKFRIGTFWYEIRYTTDIERKELRVTKLPADPDQSDWTDENIILESLVSRPNWKFVGGKIRYTKYFKEGGIESFSMTNTAIQKVREFFAANF